MSNAPSPQTLTLRRPDDWHLHLRDGSLMAGVVMDTARQFSRAIVMPNLLPPVTTVTQACAYRERILAALKSAAQSNNEAAPQFEPLMTLYLTNDTTPDEIRRARESGIVQGVKLYPAKATTNSDAGVTDVLKHCGAVLEAMQRHGLPLLVHGEVTDPLVDIFDREAVFIERVMQPLRRAFPELKVVLEHLTTKEGVAYVTDAPEQGQGKIGATITAHHLLYNRNALFQGGLRPHWYCLPVLKRETHRLALLAAATSGNPRFFLGTDSAPHPRGLKEFACGCAGCYTALHALPLYASAFEAAGQLHHLEAFASLNGAAFYGLPVNAGALTLEKRTCVIPEALTLPDGTDIVPLAGGEVLNWCIH